LSARELGVEGQVDTRALVPADPSVESMLQPLQLALRRARQKEDSHNTGTLYFPANYERDMFVTLAQQSRTTLERVRICTSDSTPSASFECSIWRDLAATGVSVRAIYLVSHMGLLKSSLSERIRLDLDAGLDVRVIAAHDLTDDIADLQLGDTFLIDGRIAAYRNWLHDPSRDAVGLWTITIAEDHLRQLARSFSSLWGAATDPRNLAAGLDLEEPLAQSAPILAQVAPVLCQGDHVDTRGCEWYHGTWQYLRLMDLVSTPTWHHDFYKAALAEALADGARRILITGTADYSVFAYVLDSLREVVDGSVTVVDRCQTPLFACQWYAKRLGFTRAKLVADDVLAFFAKEDEPFDVVITDAFLTRFTGTSVSAVLAGWRDVLQEHGRVITTIRVHSESEYGLTPDEAVEGFRGRAQVRWRRWTPFIEIRPEEIAKRAETYARQMVSSPIGSQAHIMALLREYFSLKDYDLANVPGELYPTKYMRVMMKKE
jgi:hypothetical protein